MNEESPVSETVSAPTTEVESEIRPIELKNRWMALLLAWLFPGLGHLYQGRTVKGILFAVCLVPLIAAGIWMGSYWREVPPDGGGFQSMPQAAPQAASTVEGNSQAAPQAAPSESRELMLGRCGYFSWRTGDKRLYFIPQAANAAVALPALIQSRRVEQGKEPFLYGLGAPPRLPSQNNRQPTFNEILLALDSWFDLGTIFLAVAGLLNVLVLFDAFAGPAWMRPDDKKNDSLKEKNDEISEK